MHRNLDDAGLLVYIVQNIITTSLYLKESALTHTKHTGHAPPDAIKTHPILLCTGWVLNEYSEVSLYNLSFY